jgi:hypothetical protein
MSKELQDFFDNLPEKFDIIENGISVKELDEYIKYGQNTDLTALTEDMAYDQGELLFGGDITTDQEKLILYKLSGLGTIRAYRMIEKYIRTSENGQRPWNLLSLYKCKMLLENSLLDESQGIIMTGLGGVGDRLRCYFMILPDTAEPLSKINQEVAQKEFGYVCKRLNSILEKVQLSERFIGFTVLIPLDIAIGEVIESGIGNCNKIGQFLLEHYYVTNDKIPDESEIDEIINMVRG